METPSTLAQLWEHDGELAVAQRDARAPDIERPVQPNAACEAAELAFDQVICVRLRPGGRRLLADDEQEVVATRNTQRRGQYADRIHAYFEVIVGVEHIEGGAILSRVPCRLVMETSRQLIEEPSYVVAGLGHVRSRDEGQGRHRVMFSQNRAVDVRGHGVLP